MLPQNPMRVRRRSREDVSWWSWSRLLGSGCRRGLNRSDCAGNGVTYDRIRIVSPLLKGLDRQFRGGPHRAQGFCREVSNERPVILEQRQDREQGVAGRRTELG